MTNTSKIGRGTVIRGSIRGEGDLEVEGRVEGVLDIDGDITLLDSARVRISEGVLSGRAVAIHGAVSGNVLGSTGIVLESGARVVGDLTAPRIGIRPGGLLRGQVTTGDESSAPVARGRAAARGRAPQKAAPARPAPVVAAPQRPAPRAAAATTQRTGGAEKAAYAEAAATTHQAGGRSKGAPAPVMPSLRKGQKGQMKRRGGK
jgi:cytoskeletal protein CcmA (bactofilin family)